MNRNPVLISIMVITTLFSCNTNQTGLPLIGTWELVSATTTEKDSTFSTFDPKRKMIKIINATHFAFLNHSLNTGKDSSSAPFSAGGGNYTLTDSAYTEHLDYFTDKEWENHKFDFVVTFNEDTLTQKGVEKIEKLGIDRVITEKYIRVKQ